MGGLDKVTIEDIDKWIKNRSLVLLASEKLDGVSFACTYENYNLIFCATRGDGTTGQNILKKALYFMPKIKTPERISLRGEILLTGNIHKSFGFKNRRNGVTGLIRRDDINPNDLKLLKPVFYEIVEYNDMPNTELYRLKLLKDFGLSTPNIFIINSSDANLTNTLCGNLEKYKEESEYDIDGLVLTINDSERENVLFPKNKVKFKVNELASKCKVIGIEWNVTRLGYIKPVILIEPTEIMGTTVSRVSGFNAQFILDSYIDKDAIIGVVRSGDVIPYVTEVFKEATVNMIHKCPSCGQSIYLKSKELICENPNCKGKNILEVSHFFIKMGVDGISDKTIENLDITNIPDMYKLTKNDISKLSGFGEKKAELIIDEIKKTLKTTPEKLLASFGIPMIGRTLSKQLCTKFTIDELFNIKDSNVFGLGDITSQTLFDNLQNYLPLYNYLKSIGLEFEKEDMESKTLKGMKFTLTGEGPLKRTEIQKLIENLGGEVKGIGKDINYLVTNDPNSKSGKMKTAEKYCVPIISYEELFRTYLK